jgi:hypothetical protein
MECINPCNLHNNFLSPYHGENAKYLLISESPESAKNLLTPNKSVFWELMSKYNLTKDQFKIIHSINCFNKNKPSEYHRNLCRPNIENILKDFDPE